jgi:hypothetical protein
MGIREMNRSGFVFVTVEVGGNTGSVCTARTRYQEVAPWIKKHSYVVRNSMPDDSSDSRLLFSAKCLSSGICQGHVFAAHMLSWQPCSQLGRHRSIGLARVVSFAVYLSSTVPSANQHFLRADNVASAASTVRETFLLGITALICVDGAIFHSGLYVSIWLQVVAGRVWRITRAEKERTPSGLKEVLVLGDSRKAEGFSARCE